MIIPLLSKLLIPLIALLVLSGAGILVLIIEWVRSSDDVAEPAKPAAMAGRNAMGMQQSTTAVRTSTSMGGAAEQQDTVRVRTSGSMTNMGTTAAPGRREPAPAPARPEPPSVQAMRPAVSNAPRASEPPARPAAPAASAASADNSRSAKVGSNIIVNRPASRPSNARAAGRLEVIYGNFSPSDPRDIELLGDAGGGGETRYSFSKSARDSVHHIQLNHYTVSPVLQAEIVIQGGRCTLINLVPEDEADRYQTRVNGIPLDAREDQVLSPGDIISMGIFRLKMVT